MTIPSSPSAPQCASVVVFYQDSGYPMKYPFEALLLVCNGPRCNDEKNGDDRGEEIRHELKDHNKKMGRKPTVRVCSVSCLDLCDYGPNMVVEPGGDVYSHLTRKSARRAYDGVVGDGPVAEDLLLVK